MTLERPGGSDRRSSLHEVPEWIVFLGMVGHGRCAAGDETALLSAHVGTGLVFGGGRVGFVLLDPVHIQASYLQALRFAHCWGSQHPDTEPLGHVLWAKARKHLWRVQTLDFRAHFSKIHQH